MKTTDARMTTPATPGPWKVNGDDVENAEGAGVCAMYADETADANARLIAAAPEMRDILAWLTTPVSGTMPDVVARIRALLARIEGEAV